MKTYQVAFPLLAIALASGCSGRDTTDPTSALTAPGSASSSRESDEARGSHRGTLHLEKECSQYTGMAGSFCTITASNLAEDPVGTREFALKDAGLHAATLYRDGVLFVREGKLSLNY